jgi:hypothetical protein
LEGKNQKEKLVHLTVGATDLEVKIIDQIKIKPKDQALVTSLAAGRPSRVMMSYPFQHLRLFSDLGESRKNEFIECIFTKLGF